MIAGPSAATHIRCIALPHKCRNANGHGRANAIIEHESQSADCHKHLIARQSHSAKPTGHDCAYRKCPRLHPHLQRNGQRQSDDAAHVGHSRTRTQETRPVRSKHASPPQINRAHDNHSHARTQRADACPQKPQFRESEFAEYQQIIETDIKNIAKQQNPHSDGCPRQAIRELPHCIEPCHKNDRSKNRQIIRTYQRQQFLRLPETIQEKVQRSHHQCQRHAKRDIRNQSMTELPARLFVFAASKKGANQRRYPIRKPQQCNYRQIKHIVYKRCGSKRCRIIMAHHHRIGESKHNNSYLPNHHWQTEFQCLTIMLQISTVHDAKLRQKNIIRAILHACIFL